MDPNYSCYCSVVCEYFISGTNQNIGIYLLRCMLRLIQDKLQVNHVWPLYFGAGMYDMTHCKRRHPQDILPNSPQYNMGPQIYNHIPGHIKNFKITGSFNKY